ncbi:hypothetical protein ACLKA7_013443 [Drosophila subpalustris]
MQGPHFLVLRSALRLILHNSLSHQKDRISGELGKDVEDVFLRSHVTVANEERAEAACGNLKQQGNTNNNNKYLQLSRSYRFKLQLQLLHLAVSQSDFKPPHSVTKYGRQKFSSASLCGSTVLIIATGLADSHHPSANLLCRLSTK